MLKIGCFVSLKKPDMFYGAVQAAIAFQANTFMVYSGPPTNTQRVALNNFKISEALTLLKQHQINPDDLVGHAPYIINLANPNPVNRSFAIDFLTQEIIRFNEMQISQMVLHPGNALRQTKNTAIELIAQGINQIFKNTSHCRTKIALETMAGKGTEIGREFQELKAIIQLIQDQSRIKVCFDTCHVFDAGYDIKNNFLKVIELFDQIIGLKYLSCLHINDSKNCLGSKKDRHQNLGLGQIGLKALMEIIYHPLFLSLPKILETPYIDGQPIYKQEIIMIRTENHFD
ncbi:Endonuclease IV [Candidatus Phytoplasma mali]|uniref:Probable endonuclease 4 n=1 Tax=Phytoplasma mali (strain AT) TaxID=482235 RepID=B3R050_PHYMT|nr:deoxyribonuclease IV [Candidatus Phytoplasma mali]CAP18214.1 Endonuclease IV [Candidatus Phytoplasma mali]CAP18658.1 Endonuclease IV [Candidatus Phytoplasma mali]